MTTSREESAADPETDRAGVVHRLRRGARWLRDLHRGFAHTGHLPRRED